MIRNIKTTVVKNFVFDPLFVKPEFNDEVQRELNEIRDDSRNCGSEKAASEFLATSFIMLYREQYTKYNPFLVRMKSFQEYADSFFTDVVSEWLGFMYPDSKEFIAEYLKNNRGALANG